MDEKSTSEHKSFFQHVQNKQRLAQTYMAFIKNGGLFIPTDAEYELGEEVELRLRLFTEPHEYKLPCKVIWITPRYAQEGRVSGIGVQFLEGIEATEADKIIHSFLEMLDTKERRSDTL